MITLASRAPAPPETVQIKPAAMIEIPINWTQLRREKPVQAKQELLRVRIEFQQAFAAGLVAAGIERSSEQPRYLLYTEEVLRSV